MHRDSVSLQVCSGHPRAVRPRVKEGPLDRVGMGYAYSQQPFRVVSCLPLRRTPSVAPDLIGRRLTSSDEGNRGVAPRCCGYGDSIDCFGGFACVGAVMHRANFGLAGH